MKSSRNPEIKSVAELIGEYKCAELLLNMDASDHSALWPCEPAFNT